MTIINADSLELQKFGAAAHRWWDKKSEFRTLHAINPARLEWINSLAPLSGKVILDVGCGGGILSESMAFSGAQVTAIDLSEKPLEVANLHSLESGVSIRYELISAEALAMREPASFDVVTCMEMLEHVPDPTSIVVACAQLVKPGGKVFFSTINRSMKAYFLAILGAEYLLRLLPRGTHEHAKFITPAELACALRKAGLRLDRIAGMGYNPITHAVSINQNVSVNYMVACTREAI